jgi:tetratricopeptide (TPR) repeat protein
MQARTMWRRAVAAAALLVGLLVAVEATTRFNNDLSGVFAPPALPTLSPQGHNIAVGDNLRRNRPVQALYHIEALADRFGWTPDLHQQAGDLWHTLGDTDRALFHWQQAAITTEDAALLRTLADGYMLARRWGAAADALALLINLQPENTWANFHLGMLRAPYDAAAAEPYLRQAALDPLYNEAARAVRVALIENRDLFTFDPVQQPMLVGLTLIEQELWDYAALAFAEADALSRSLSGEPFPTALAYLSLAQDRQGSAGAAAIITAVQLSPNDPQIRFLLGLHRRHVGDYGSSLEAMIQAAALAPESAALYAELGTAYRLVGDLEEAERWFQTAVNLSGGDPEFERLLALFYAEEAFELGSGGLLAIEDALQDAPEDPNLLAGQGWALYAMGQTEAGIAQVQQALAVDPTNPRARYYRAQILLVEGENLTEARRILEALVASEGAFSLEAERLLENNF